MAAIENEHLVVNVVYTGPPLAGKTQSVRALMPLLEGRGAERRVLSPGDWRGRTAFFDWVMYEGGAYQGKSIHCRIISTPGQVALSDRREMLLRSADAVILVIDSQPDGVERAVHCYEEMAPWLAEASRDVPVRVVLQCNKQDLPGSLPADELSKRLGVPCGKDVYATSASTGKGLRAAFVAGVRNAVERAGALVARGLVLEAPEVTSGEELFERMRREVAPIGSAPPGPVGSGRVAPSAPAPASRLAASGSGAARPDSERAGNARPSARGKSESARPSVGRGSSKAPASSGATSSSSTRPAATKAGPGPASPPFGSSTFGSSKSKSSSGFFPAAGVRPSSRPERSSTHPPLPPDHPFAPNAVLRPSARRPGSGSSRPAPASTGAAGASGAIPRPQSSDRAPPASADDKSRSARQARHAPAAPPAARATPAGGVRATPRLRSGRGDGADAAATGSEAVAARSGTDATGAAGPARIDTRPSLTAVSARAAAEAATARAPAAIDALASSVASLVVPAADSPGSVPPSSEAASTPTSSGWRALVDGDSEAGDRALERVREPRPPVSPHPKGWLDPAGDVARAWRPDQGPRPAILPASAYHARVPAELEARREQLAAAATQTADAAAGMTPAADAERSEAARRAGAPESARRDAAPKRPPQVRAQPRTFVAGSPRPAVMPARVYFAAMAAAAQPALGAAGASGSIGPDALAQREPTRAPLATPSGSARSGRPAVMPASAYFASLAARDAAAAQEAGAGNAGSPATARSGATTTPEQKPASTATKPRGRPAVMPASAWRAAIAAGEAVPARAQPDAPASSSARIDSRAPLPMDEDPVDSGWPDAGEVLSMAPPFAAGVQRPSPKKQRPAVMPADAWRARVERGELPDDSAKAARDPSAAAAALGPNALDNTPGSGDADDEWLARSGDGARHEARGARPLRLLRGGTQSRRSDDLRAPAARPSLTLLERPAVMPVAALGPRRARTLAPASPSTARSGPTRPAVMPASAWRAALEAEQARSGVATSADEQAQLEPTTPAPEPAPVAAASLDGVSTEPAASGNSNGDGAPRAANDGALAASPALPALTAADGNGPLPVPADVALDTAVEEPRAAAELPAPDAASQPAAGSPASDKPTIAPASDLLLATERPTIVAAALAEPAISDRRDTPDEFADPATFGLESSRLIAAQLDPHGDPPHAHSDESSESFRIPETPPGLQAFVAKARLNTPPPPAPAPGDDLIPSLAPAQGELAAGATGSERHEPPEFAGPRMPGHARAPRAVWRRSIWRTLEMHITSDATALEDARGRWIGELAPGWYARTLRSASDARSARRAFAEEVLRERRLRPYLSRPRCVALTAEADRYWIWQAACRVPTLAAVLGRRLAARESPSAMAEALLDASRAFVEARQRFIQARVPLPLSLHALSVQDDELVYSGLLPDPGAVFVHPPSDGHTAFEDALRKKWPSAPIDGSAVFAELSGKAAGRLPEPILAIIRSVVGQSSIDTSTKEVSG